MTIIVVKDAEEKAIVLTRLVLNEIKEQWRGQTVYKFDDSNDRICDFVENVFPSVVSTMENYLLSDGSASVSEKEDMIRKKLEASSYFQSEIKSYFGGDFAKRKKQLEEQGAKVDDNDVMIHITNDDIFRFTRHTVSELVEGCLDLLNQNHNKLSENETETINPLTKDTLVLFAKDQDEPRSVHEVLNRLRQRSGKPDDTGNKDKTKPSSAL